MKQNMMIIAAVAIAAALVIAGGAYLLMNQGEGKRDTSVSVLAMVNAEGSGIFCRYQIATDNGGGTIFAAGSDGSPLSVPALAHPSNSSIGPGSGWGGLCFMTPGAGSIQHEMLKTLAIDLGLTFASGTGTDTDKLYWTAVPPGQMGDYYMNTANIDGGITWEPWYSSLLERFGSGVKRAYSIATSSDIEPGHPCCMIVGNNAFVNANDELTLRFLLAYIESVEWVQAARTAGMSSAAGAKLIEFARATAFAPGNTTSDATIWSALQITNFDYDISALKAYVAGLVVRFEGSGAITEHVTYPALFANTLINEGPLSNAVSFHDTRNTFKNPNSAVGTVRLGMLGNDLHQIAIRVAMIRDAAGPSGSADKTLFDIYGVNIDLKAFQPNGPGVMNLFAANEIDIGVLGLPPTVIRVANGL